MSTDLLRDDVVIADKVHHKRAMHYLIEAGGVLPLNGGLFGIRFLPNQQGDFVGLQLFSEGIRSRISFSVNKRVNKVVKKKDEGKVSFKGGEENLF